MQNPFERVRFRVAKSIERRARRSDTSKNILKLMLDKVDDALKTEKESAYYEMSYSEKRKKDKAFGKMVKNYKKMKRKID